MRYDVPQEVRRCNPSSKRCRRGSTERTPTENRYENGFKGLLKDDRKKIGADIATVEYGWPLGMPTCRPMGNGLHEVRTGLKQGRIARVLFCVHEDEMVLLHGLIKKTEKTPPTDVALARKRRKETTR